MKTRLAGPIQFDAESMRANLAGLKTETRRLLNPQPLYDEPTQTWRVNRPTRLYVDVFDSELRCQPWLFYPVHRPGDVCWVQEPHYLADNGLVYYPASDDIPPSWKHKDVRTGRPSLRPARWMRREWHRARVTFLSVRAERLLEIRYKAIHFEGAPAQYESVIGMRSWFQTRWNGLHTKDGPWESNPWVVVYQYRFELNR
jgi:hypothetical protein